MNVSNSETHLMCSNNMSAKLGKDIIDTYEKYRNTSTKWKVTNISTQKF